MAISRSMAMPLHCDKKNHQSVDLLLNRRDTRTGPWCAWPPAVPIPLDSPSLCLLSHHHHPVDPVVPIPAPPNPAPSWTYTYPPAVHIPAPHPPHPVDEINRPTFFPVLETCLVIVITTAGTVSWPNSSVVWEYRCSNVSSVPKVVSKNIGFGQ